MKKTVLTGRIQEKDQIMLVRPTTRDHFPFVLMTHENKFRKAGEPNAVAGVEEGLEDEKSGARKEKRRAIQRRILREAGNGVDRAVPE